MNGLATQHIGKQKLLIHADPGARSVFVAAWLTNCLTRLAFDSGASLCPSYRKIHNIYPELTDLEIEYIIDSVLSCV